MNPKQSTIESRIKGGIYALACGDYLGMPVEFASKDKVIEFYNNKKVSPVKCEVRGVQALGNYTDDTAMMLCLAESILENGFNTKDQFNKYRKWALYGYLSADGQRPFGIGQNTFRKLLNQKPEDIPIRIKHNETEGGNGALMRSLPIGLIYYNDIDEVIDKTISSALVTHNNCIAVWTSVVFNIFVVYACLGINKFQFISQLKKEETYPEIPQEITERLLNLSEKSENELEVSGYSLSTLEVALYSFLYTDSLEDAISLAILQGGDTDTQGAVTGGLAGVYYGYNAIPKDWIKYLLRKDLFEKIVKQILQLKKPC